MKRSYINLIQESGSRIIEVNHGITDLGAGCLFLPVMLVYTFIVLELLFFSF